MKNKSCLATLAFLFVCAASAQDHPRVETFFGYTYTRANSATDVPAFSANGGSGQLAINASKVVGFVFDLGAVHNGNISGHHLDSTFSNFLFGPRITIRKSRVHPYFNVLFGGMHASTSTGVTGVPVASTLPVLPGEITPVPPNTPVSLRASASQTAFAMVAGGGLDIKISHHLSFRPIGLDYLLTRLQNFRSAQDNNQHNIRYTAGFNFTFGGERPVPPPPPPPPMNECWDGSRVSVGTPCPPRTMSLQLGGAHRELCPGETVTLSSSGAPQNATYEWTVNGQPIGKAPSLEFGATGREAGSYNVALRVSAPEYQPGTSEEPIVVRAYHPPTGTIVASPREILVGQKATLSANFNPGQCGGSLGTPVLSASEGSISGQEFDSSAVRFDPADTSEQRKTVTIVAKVADAKGGEGTAEVSLMVKKPAATLARRLPDILFPSGNSRVNNCGKRVLLEELKAAIDSDPSGKVVLVGHLSEKEARAAGLDLKRALNSAAVISAGSGVCSSFPASQILVGVSGAVDNGVDYQSHFCASTQELPGSMVNQSESDARYRRVEVWFVPSGGVVPASLKDYKDAASLSVSGLGCPR